MNEKLLLEHINRMGMVNGQELMRQTGAAKSLLYKPAAVLIENREIFLCRMDHGRETFMSRHLRLCLLSVFTEPNLSPDAQDLYDWLSENENATMDAMLQASGLDAFEFDSAFRELEQKLCIAPFAVMRETPVHNPKPDGEFHDEFEFLWVTDEFWLTGLPRPSRYRDLEYSLSEIRRLLKSHFSTREINDLLYRRA